MSEGTPNGRNHTPGSVIRRVRRQRGWSQQRLIFEMQRVAPRLGMTVPAPESLKAMLSRWENGHQVPDAYNRRLLAAGLRIPESTFDMPSD
ncbi:hypothetical protein Pme01_21860 [Planosporangium mesophilum]|uniref:HTH cro/C1-type domain-containing protein n=1 Tax=Planosporangium mesophilum TaxID=689768 RepID=A0A8J3TD24_9ACTN|nr:hypothetical protein Pme01_21860 [Planosporangium mesophilum]